MYFPIFFYPWCFCLSSMSKKSKHIDTCSKRKLIGRDTEHKEIKWIALKKDAVTENYIYSVYQTLCHSTTKITFIVSTSKNQTENHQ